MESSQKLFSKNFFIMGFASFLMFFAFYLLMPVIAMFIIDVYKADAKVAGLVVSAYIITALLARPFSGYLVDKYDRRKFYIITYTIFATLFLGYIFSTSILMIAITRILLGATFSLVTTAGSTLAIDIMPPERRSEGIGYIGAITVVAMAVGPMAGLYLMELFSYDGLFIFATASCFIGIFIAMMVKTKPRKSVVHEKLSLDRFFVIRATSIALVIALIYFFYGTLMTYVSLYVKECDADVNSGNFFLFLAIGIIISRIFSARFLKLGKQDFLLNLGISILIISAIIFIFHLTEVTFPLSSIALGFGFGIIAPSIQSMIVDLVPHNRRGSANSTYFIALDLGSGIGMLIGGFIANISNYRDVYIIGLILIIISLLTYRLYARNDYKRALSQNN